MNDAARTNLLGLPPAKLQAFFLDIGEKPFRAQQVLKWMHHAGVDRFEDMTNLSKSLREKLAEIAEVRPPEVVSQQDSEDGTRKWAIRVDGGGLVETVFIPDGQRGTTPPAAGDKPPPYEACGTTPPEAGDKPPPGRRT